MIKHELPPGICKYLPCRGRSWKPRSQTARRTDGRHPPLASTWLKCGRTQKRASQCPLQITHRQTEVSTHAKNMSDSYFLQYFWCSGCVPNNPFRRGLTMDRSLQGLPPIRRSNGPHSASCNTWEQFSSLYVKLNVYRQTSFHFAWLTAWTHMFPRDGANIVDIFDLSLVLDHPHGDGILTNLWGDVALDLKAQVSEHQVSCQEHFKPGERRWRGGGTFYVKNWRILAVWLSKIVMWHDKNQPVAMPSKSESTLRGLRWSAGMEG